MSEKYDDVLLPFLALMRRELHANAGKGDRPGWLAMRPDEALLEVYYHLSKLQKAVKHNDGTTIQEFSADVANMAMMVLDICGGLAWVDPAPTAEASPATELQELIGWLEKLRPLTAYGRVGTRDVDQPTLQKALDGAIASARAALSQSPPAKRLSDARDHDYPILQQFHTKYALGTLAAPSCLCCGQSTQGEEIGIQHLELPGIVICKRCTDAAAPPAKQVRMLTEREAAEAIHTWSAARPLTNEIGTWSPQEILTDWGREVTSAIQRKFIEVNTLSEQTGSLAEGEPARQGADGVDSAGKDGA